MMIPTDFSRLDPWLLDMKLCNCAKCFKEIAQPPTASLLRVIDPKVKEAHGIMRNVGVIGGRLRGRPYCVSCIRRGP